MIAKRETLTYYETCGEKMITSCLLACMGKWRRMKEHGSIFLWALDHHLDPTPAAPSIAQTTKFGLLRFRPRSGNSANPSWDANCPDHARPPRSCICKLKWKYPIVASFPQSYIDWGISFHFPPTVFFATNTNSTLVGQFPRGTAISANSPTIHRRVLSPFHFLIRASGSGVKNSLSSVPTYMALFFSSPSFD